MNLNYSRVVGRLLEYRKKLNLTQEQMGIKLGVNQSHYSKLETGSKIISMHSLRTFIKNDGDVVLLLTGEDTGYGCLEHYFRKCKTQRGMAELYRMVLWLVNQGVKLQYGLIEEIPDQYYKELRALEYGLNSISIWEGIRAVERLTQVDMAKLLDVNIKRYRRIEKGKIEPDAEILVELYEKLKYSPMIILNHKMFYEDRINKVWEGFPFSIKRKLEPFIEKTIELINEYESEKE